MIRIASRPLLVHGELPIIVFAALAALLFYCLWVSPAHAEISEGSGFAQITWHMPLGEAERAMGSRISRARNDHTGAEYLRAAPYQYRGCAYVLVLNFDEPGARLSEIVLTHRREASAEMAEQTCRAGVADFTEKLGRPISVDRGARMWRLKTTTVTVIDAPRGDVQIRYTPNSLATAPR